MADPAHAPATKQRQTVVGQEFPPDSHDQSRRKHPFGSLLDDQPPDRTTAVLDAKAEARKTRDGETEEWLSKLPFPQKALLLPMAGLNIQVDPVRTDDVTVHKSLETALDLEELLEESSRLRRLGRFKEAFSHFEEHLSSHLDNMYVLVHYGHCLLDACQYRKLVEMAKRYPPVENGDDLHCNWAILVYSSWRSRLLADDDRFYEDAVIAKCGFQFAEAKSLDSTQIQILALSTRLSYASGKNMPNCNWASLYTSLQSSERIWDFRDLFLAIEPTLGLGRTCDLFLESRAFEGRGCDALIQDWSNLDENESNYFGGLDFFANLAFACMRRKQNAEQAETYLRAAEYYGMHILRWNITNFKTRPCFVWMMAKVRLEQYKLDKATLSNISISGQQAGRLHLNRRVFPESSIPLYTPHGDEKVEWHPSAAEISTAAKETTKAVLAAAEEIGDLPSHTYCLFQLADQASSDALTVIQKIIELWDTVGNQSQRFQLLLFSFMLVRNAQEKEDLRQQILVLDNSSSANFWKKCHYMVLYALSPPGIRKDVYFEKARRIGAVTYDPPHTVRDGTVHRWEETGNHRFKIVQDSSEKKKPAQYLWKPRTPLALRATESTHSEPKRKKDADSGESQSEGDVDKVKVADDLRSVATEEAGGENEQFRPVVESASDD